MLPVSWPTHIVRLLRNTRLLPLPVPQVTKTDQFPAILVPQSKRNRPQATRQSHGFHGLKHGFGSMAPFQIVIGNPGAEMVDVMESDITGEPLQNLG